MSRRPNILLVVTDEERFHIPRPDGYSLPAHERLAEAGTSLANYYAAAAMCSSSRSVIYTGQHMPLTQIHDNDNMPYVDPLDPALGSIGTMLRDAGYYTTYQGKWHPDWRKRGFLRGFTDERYTFGRYFSPLDPNRPADVDALLADNDVVLYDRETDPGETVNLADDPAHRELVEAYRAKLEALISTEIGEDRHDWVSERPQLLGWPTWRGDAA